jgi:predicted ATPase
MVETVRAYSREKLHASGEEAALSAAEALLRAPQ